MKKTSGDPIQLEREYQRLRASVAKIGHISQGSVQDRTGRKSGRGYQWTRKVAAKTVSVALTPEQFQKMKQAVANRRALQRLIQKMEQISRQIIFETSPHPARRKRLSKKVLGLN